MQVLKGVAEQVPLPSFRGIIDGDTSNATSLSLSFTRVLSGYTKIVQNGHGGKSVNGELRAGLCAFRVK